MDEDKGGRVLERVLSDVENSEYFIDKLSYSSNMKKLLIFIIR